MWVMWVCVQVDASCGSIGVNMDRHVSELLRYRYSSSATTTSTASSSTIDKGGYEGEKDDEGGTVCPAKVLLYYFTTALCLYAASAYLDKTRLSR